jgi:tungstate transport system substrate-binding protein
MGASLNISASIGAYILSDRASWLNFKNKSDLEILFSDDKLLLNQYSFIPINPIRHDHVESKLAEELENWLTSDTAKSLINGYEIGGQALFKFNAKQE